MKNFFRLSLTTQIVIGILVGIAWGIFFGESSLVWAPVGKAFFMLLQMPVILFLFTSIVVGIGQLSIKNAKEIFFYSFIFLVGSWSITLISVFLLPLGFPPIKTINKYAAPNLDEHLEKSNLFDYFIPENPFKAFAQGTIPAVVVFSILFAFALLLVKRKNFFLNDLKVVQSASLNLVQWITKFSPLGVFALTASTAGIRRLVDFQEIQYYYYSFIFASLFVSLILVPLFTSVFLPFSFRDILSPLKPALLVAFSTGSVLVTLPIIITEMNKKNESFGFTLNQNKALSNTLVPLAYNFPISGKLINMIFIYFIAWHYKINITTTKALESSLFGILTFFGSTSDAIVFLLDFLDLPIDSLNLFISSTIITIRFSALAIVTSIAALCFFTVTALENRLTFSFRKLLVALFVTIIGFGGYFFAIKTYGKPIVSKEKSFLDLSIEEKAPFKIVNKENIFPRAWSNDAHKNFDLIKKSKILRVGFLENTMPFAYKNTSQELVGFDIESAHTLANELDLQLVLVPLKKDEIMFAISDGIVDIAMSGIFLNNKLLMDAKISTPYLEESQVFVVLDKNKQKFGSLKSIDENVKNSIGTLENSVFFKEAKTYFPKKEIVTFASYDDFINNEKIDAILWVMPQALTWTMINPQYSVVHDKALEKVNYVYILADENGEFLDFINNWIKLKTSHNFYSHLYDKWVLNKKSTEKKRRWSIWQDIIFKFSDD